MRTKLGMIIAITVSAFILSACPAPAANTAKAAEQPKAAENTTAKAVAETAKANATTNVSAPAPPVLKDKTECLKAKMEGKRLIASQTFLFEYEPFRGSCFVTFASKEDMLDEKDVPRGSTFHIFKDGKKVYDFEDAFDGQAACWVEGVGFEDLNNDGKIDVVMAGSCLGAKNSYPSNAIYMNKGNEFQTIASANQKLEKFKTIKQIVEYVKSQNK